MSKMTVNAAMVMAKAIRGRLGELSSLRSQCATKDTFFGTKEKVVEPMYDMKVLDKKCVELENFLMDVDMKIKQSNAVTEIEVESDAKVLFAPLT